MDEIVIEEPGSGVVIGRTLKIAGEALVAPGSSLILDGQILPGAVHVVGGLLAKWALGPVGLLLVAANSYTRSVTGGNLTQFFKRDALARAADNVADRVERAADRLDEKPRSGRKPAEAT
jgi:hypothetical protein